MKLSFVFCTIDFPPQKKIVFKNAVLKFSKGYSLWRKAETFIRPILSLLIFRNEDTVFLRN